MKTLKLDYWETQELKRDGAVEIRRNGYDILVEVDKYNDDNDYIIVIINPYSSVKLTEKQEERK